MGFFTRLLRAVWFLLLIAVGLYGLVVTALLVARMLVGEAWAAVGLFNSVLPVALLPGGVFAVLLLSRLLVPASRAVMLRLLLLQLPAVIAFGVLYYDYFLPRTTAAATDLADSAPTVTVLTYNAYYINRDTAAVLDIIGRADPDVIALQELNDDLAAGLTAALADAYPHQYLLTLGESPAGKGILSRLPFSDAWSWRDGWQQQQRVTLDVNGAPVIFYNFHAPTPFRLPFGYSSAERARSVSRLLTDSAAHDVPVIAAGDFNLSDASLDYWRITRTFSDSYRQVGAPFGWTFPDFADLSQGLAWMQPFVRIDYVFHSAAFTPVSAQVFDHSGGSDHRPLRVELALRADSSP